MHDLELGDQLRIGQEYLPRFSQLLPRVLIVPAGETVELPPDSTYDAIEVSGTLRVARDRDTTCTFTHFVTLPGGHFDCGTADDPVRGRVALVIADVPLDPRDPFQWGNSILNFGKHSRVGVEKTPWLTLAQDAGAGVTTLHLSAEPVGWQAGDEILLPDMRALGEFRGSPPPRRSGRMTIAAIDGTTLTLSAPLDFARASIVKPNGDLVARPYIANLTRNITIRSANPAGTRGHTSHIGSAASWDVRYNEYIGVGRTTFDVINNTTTDAAGNILTVGTNQIGKYADHAHHCHSSVETRQTIGNVYKGTQGSKWAFSIHATSDTRLEGNIAVDFQGGGFVTEDGPEVRNLIKGNFVVYSSGNGRGASGNTEPTTPLTNAPGGEGSGFWFRGPHNRFIGNVSINNVVGINLFGQDFIGGSKPTVESVPGGPRDMVIDLNSAVPVEMSGNVTLCNVQTGCEYWSMAKFPNVGLVTAGNGGKQIFLANSQSNNGFFRDLQLFGGPSSRQDAFSTSAAYIGTLEIDGGYIGGCNIGIERGGAIVYVRAKNVTFQCRTNMLFAGTPREADFDNCMHLLLPGYPERFIVFRSDEPWKPGEPLTKEGGRAWAVNEGSKFRVRNWQGTGKDYQLFIPQQGADTAAWPAYDGDYPFYVPEEGLTMRQSWAKYGMAYFGDVLEPSEGVELVGLIDAKGREGLSRPLPVPRTVLNIPNRISPAEVASGKVGLYLLVTGDPARATRAAVFQVDGGPVQRTTGSVGSVDNARKATTTAAAEGIHTVKTWREDATGAKVPGSDLAFTYAVGATPPPPVDCVQGPWVVQSVGEWSEWETAGDIQARTRTITETRETLTQPANGGTVCGPSTQTRTETETRSAWVRVDGAFVEQHRDPAITTLYRIGLTPDAEPFTVKKV